MASTVSLKKVFSRKSLPKLVSVNVQIVGFVTSKKLKIRDSNQVGQFYLDINLAEHYMLRYFEISRMIKIINPGVNEQESTLVIEKKTIVSKGTKIEGIEDVSPYATVSSTFDMDKKCQVPGKILGRVVKIFEPKYYQTSYGSRIKYIIRIKDIAGDLQTIGMFRGTHERLCVSLGKAYIFSNLVTEAFPDEKPHNLSLDKDSNAVLASEEEQRKMALLKYADGQFSGKILAIHSPIFYSSCNHCKCSVKNSSFNVGDKCPKCHKAVTEVIADYSFTLVVENGNCNDISMTCFRTYLPVETKGTQLTQDLLEDTLCKKYEGKTVMGDYVKKRYPENGVNFNVETFNFA